MNVLVVGGTGNVGSEVTRQLVAKGVPVSVMTRSPEKAALPPGARAVAGDLANPATLPAAMRGADAVFLLTALSQTETHEGLAGVEAARAAGVKRLVYMSVHRLDEGAVIPHFASKIPIEHAVRTSGLEWTLIRPNNFFQVDFWFQQAIAQYGVYPQPIGTPGCSRVDVRDIATAAAKSLTEAGHHGKTYSLVGPDLLSGPDVAAAWARHLGREVRYGGDDVDAWGEQAKAMLPEWLVIDLKIMYRYFQEHGLAATPAELAELESLLGRKSRSFESFAAEVAPSWRA